MFLGVAIALGGIGNICEEAEQNTMFNLGILTYFSILGWRVYRSCVELEEIQDQIQATQVASKQR